MLLAELFSVYLSRTNFHLIPNLGDDACKGAWVKFVSKYWRVANA